MSRARKVGAAGAKNSENRTFVGHFVVQKSPLRGDSTHFFRARLRRALKSPSQPSISVRWSSEPPPVAERYPNKGGLLEGFFYSNW